MNTWLVTGGTGFLGGQLLKELSERGDQVFALARASSLARMKSGLRLKNVEWLAGDILNPDVVLDASDRSRVLAETTGVVHMAALYDLQASRKDLYLSNVVGTHNVLHLAEDIPTLKEFHYTSTIAVAGNYSGLLGEEMFDVGQSFPDGYAATKFAAESAVRDWGANVARVVHRLGILVGHSETGEIPKIDGPYYLLRLLKRLSIAKSVLNAAKILPLPFNERTRVYMVPVDVTAKAMTELIASGHEPGLHTYHLTGDPHGAPIRAVIREMLEACGFDVHVLAVPSVRLLGKAVRSLDIPEETLFYMNSGARYDNQRFSKKLPQFQFPLFESYGEKILRYAVESLLKGGAR